MVVEGSQCGDVAKRCSRKIVAMAISNNNNNNDDYYIIVIIWKNVNRFINPHID